MYLASNWGRLLVDLLLPSRCPLCEERIVGEAALCQNCFVNVRFITSPLCDCCGYPFEVKNLGQASDQLCAACIQKPPLFFKARSVVVYDETSKKLILSLKYGDQTDLVPLLAKWLVRGALSLITDDSLLVPVPLHAKRLRERQYNQAGLLAEQVGCLLKLKVNHDVLQRSKNTLSQGHLSSSQRFQNVQHAFYVQHANRLKGKDILLIDDVFTTGSTVKACTQVLLRTGARTVSVLTLARVV